MSARPPWSPTLASWLIRVASRIVPPGQRDDWLGSWDAEVRMRWSHLGPDRRASIVFQTDLVMRAAGAAGHALFLRFREWTPEILFQDLAFALRALQRRPTYTAVAVLTLTIGIGATTAIFSVVQSVLLRPLPYHDPDRLAMIWQTLPEAGAERSNVSLPNLVDWRARARSFEAIAASSSGRSFETISGGEEPRRIPAASVTDNFFDVLGVRPLLGRGFVPGENEPGAPRVVVLGERMWTRDFGGRPDVIGRTLEISGDAHTIVGVAPASLTFPDVATELWRPLQPENGLIVSGPVGRDGYVVRAVGRLAAGATVKTAQAEMDAISADLEREYPALNQGVGAWVVPLHEEIVHSARPMLFLLMGAVGMLLLIACANVANLSLFRAAGRQREMAIRSAVGAGKLRLTRQLITESLVLGLAGGLLGLLAATLGIRTLVRFLPAELPRLEGIAIDPAALWFTAGISLFAVLLFGLAPVLRAARSEVGEGLKASVAAGRRWGMGGPVVVAQLALALVLGGGAGLLIKSLWQLNLVDPGLRSEGVISMRVRTTSPSLSGPARMAFFEDVVLRVRSLPEVGSAGLVQHAPFGGGVTG